MYAENVKSQMRKGMLEYSIMLLLKEKPYYSSDIIEELEESNLIVVEGTLYPLLSRLKKFRDEYNAACKYAANEGLDMAAFGYYMW